ncbi:ATP-binding cassette domain-containing protein [Thiohalocapsa marina]|uniref:ATP-binding cassette domain-containing protein n=1 Tax=Thiohalocapsa marina TaxID=424902 RepID=A0A5M8FBG9_9GAMM|nr:ATP-binding cassette domain-containing protein [Thiohalocapsa marina]KAA6182223.1 ATP-binding cassette domain-containing protein [Thiohalocapsa marina]
MFELRRLTKRYGNRVVLANLDLEFHAGRATALIGPSGCGKSTLLRLLIGLIQPDTGEVLFDGEPLAPERLAPLRQRMGYVIQQGGLFPHLTARDNLGLMPQHLGWSSKRIQARIAELAELTHFPLDGLERYPQELSGGQNQRVALMRALMLDPEVLLLDEPLGALDPMVRFDLQTELREIFQRLQKTVVLVTHDLGEASYLADEILLMRAGQILQRGRLEAMLQAPADAFVARFIRAQRSHSLESNNADPALAQGDQA